MSEGDTVAAKLIRLPVTVRFFDSIPANKVESVIVLLISIDVAATGEIIVVLGETVGVEQYVILY